LTLRIIIKFQWDVNLREQFRSGIVKNLKKLNTIINNDNSLSRDTCSINNMLNDFTNTIRNVADPLFDVNLNSVYVMMTILLIVKTGLTRIV